MFEIQEINNSKPYSIFQNYYDLAIKHNQGAIEAIAIASLNKNTLEVESRFVNLKYIIDDNWIFFSNYNSNKATNFKTHNQISALMYWNTINTQIRIKAKVYRCDENFSDQHFKNRSRDKNALAISSDQSKKIDSYDSIKKKYNKKFESSSNLTRPNYWGGYRFIPYYFEFWEGNNSRINKRVAFEKNKMKWNTFILEP